MWCALLLIRKGKGKMRREKEKGKGKRNNKTPLLVEMQSDTGPTSPYFPTRLFWSQPTGPTGGYPCTEYLCYREYLDSHFMSHACSLWRFETSNWIPRTRFLFTQEMVKYTSYIYVELIKVSQRISLVHISAVITPRRPAPFQLPFSPFPRLKLDLAYSFAVVPAPLGTRSIRKSCIRVLCMPMKF